MISDRQLECVRALVIEGDYVRAARRVGISRSTLSHHLEMVRQSLDVVTTVQAVAILALSGALSATPGPFISEWN